MTLLNAEDRSTSHTPGVDEEFDILERLEHRIHDAKMDHEQMMDDAAEEIKRLRAALIAQAPSLKERCEELEKALRDVKDLCGLCLKAFRPEVYVRRIEARVEAALARSNQEAGR